MTKLVPTPPITNHLIRRYIILAFWSTIIFLGLPFWYFTTTLERQLLPSQSYSDSTPLSLNPIIRLQLQGQNTTELEHSLATSTLTTIAQKNGIQLVILPESGVASFNSRDEDGGASTYIIALSEGTTPRIEIQSNGLDIVQPPNQQLDTNHILNILHDLLRLEPISDSRVIKFAPTYKLMFSLMNQDASAVTPAGNALFEWDIRNLLDRHISPLLDSLSPLHTFIIETQIQYFAPLTINVASSEIGGTLIEEDDLRAFVNSAGWNMPSSVTLDPVLHFILYAPKPEARPMRIKTTSGTFSESNAFVTPQHGGVVIYNPPTSTTSPAEVDLSPAFQLFSHQLRTLLGVPPLPSSYSPTTPSSKGEGIGSRIIQWQLDALLRTRLRQVSQETTETWTAINKLVKDLTNVRIGKEVVKEVGESMKEMELATRALLSSSNSNTSELSRKGEEEAEGEVGQDDGGGGLQKAMNHVAKSGERAARAYYHPTMLALLYFPDEHKYAVYTPLFGPVAVPLLVAAIKEIKEWRERRRKRRKEQEEEKKKKKE